VEFTTFTPDPEPAADRAVTLEELDAFLDASDI